VVTVKLTKEGLQFTVTADVKLPIHILM